MDCKIIFCQLRIFPLLGEVVEQEGLLLNTWKNLYKKRNKYSVACFIVKLHTGLCCIDL